MASTFSSWETDPFFAAAEDVQQSADRMESAYRDWIHKKALAEENPAGQRTINICNNDVATALDTTKWQLEEFAKAVTESDTLILQEEVSKRHFSFIEAIQNQIFLIDNALHKCIDSQLPSSFYSVEFNGAERDQLEMFLLGGTSSPASDQLASDVKQPNSFLASSKIHLPVSSMKRPMATGLPCKNHQGFGASSSSSECFADVCNHQHQNTCSEIIQADTVPKRELLETRFLQDSKVSSGRPNPNFIPMVQSVDSDKRVKSVSNGFRRWKNGSLCITIKEDATSCHKDQEQAEVDSVYFPEESRSHRQNYLQIAGRWRLQRSLVSGSAAFPGQRASFVVVLICLCCMYFWFLSSLVPYMNTVFPHSFRD